MCSSVPTVPPCRPYAMQSRQGDDHDVEEDTPGAHSHDHSHAAVRMWRFRGGHIHWHLHIEDREADAKLNGHIHPLRPRSLPWETDENY